MKLKTYFSTKHWLGVLRRQPKHTQRLAAFIFAGTITSIIAGFILYTDYGFWHERYVRNAEETSTTTEDKTTATSESVSESFSKFFNESRVKFNNIGNTGAKLFEGKETYTK